MAARTQKSKLPREEILYREAVGLQEAVTCALRFETRRDVLRAASEKFESIKEYKDSGELAQVCRDEARREELSGAEALYGLALSKEQEASSKLEYFDVIEEFKRLRGTPEYAAQAKEHIAVCRKRIAALEKKRVWKGRGTALLVLAGLCGGLYVLWQYSEGFQHLIRTLF